jgi:UDP-N-acetylglucosamine 1-carboxyvinyltransferase
VDKIVVTGGVPLKGTIEISGAKNAALPLMAVSLLTKESVTFFNVPHLSDITTMANLLVQLGVGFGVDGRTKSKQNGRVLTLSGADVQSTCAPYEIVRKMRASVVVMGPLLARFGHAEISLPGGCAIGARPIDLHLNAFEKMGAEIILADGYVKATVDGRLQGAEITFDKVSVGATQNVLMAATLAEGITVLNNAACEPEIADLANCLNAMGAKITGIDSPTLTIEGVDELGSAEHVVMADRIEAGTYAVAAIITGGELTLTNVDPNLLVSTLDALEQMGAQIDRFEDSIHVKAGTTLKPVDLSTEPYPGFPTDMQAQLVALLCVADGTAQVDENIFENRFMHVPELQRMGANIVVDGHSLAITGVESFSGAEVMATDLRASVAMVLAALSTPDTTTIRRVYHIDRGYERVEEKLSAVGAKIERLKDVE